MRDYELDERLEYELQHERLVRGFARRRLFRKEFMATLGVALIALACWIALAGF